MVHSPITPDSDAGLLIQRLGYAGLVPFATLAVLLHIVTPEAHPFVAIALSAYAATIAAFLGGIHGASACGTTRRNANCTWCGASHPRWWRGWR